MEGRKETKTPTRMVKDWEVLLESFKTYRYTTDNANHYISRDYVIPSTSTFPAHLHGIKLGKLLEGARQSFRENKLTPFQIYSLEQYQIHWDSQSYRWEFLYLPALDMYKSMYGHVRVPIKPQFVIPLEHEWPEALWGVTLGRQVTEWRMQKDTIACRRSFK